MEVEEMIDSNGGESVKAASTVDVVVVDDECGVSNYRVGGGGCGSENYDRK